MYYHKTDVGAEYLCSNFILCANGHKEGIFDSQYIVRIDGDITKDAELIVKNDHWTEQHECEQCGELNTINRDTKGNIVPEDCAFCPNTK